MHNQVGRALWWVLGALALFAVFVVANWPSEQRVQVEMDRQVDKAASQALHQGARLMQQSQQRVADDWAAQYEMAKRSGSKADVCVRAGMVAEAYLQAKDEPKYREWKVTQKQDCQRAGMGFMTQ